MPSRKILVVRHDKDVMNSDELHLKRPNSWDTWDPWLDLGPILNPLNSCMIIRLLGFPCPLFLMVSWSCWTAGRKKCAACFSHLTLSMRSGTTAWWLEPKPGLHRKTYRQKHGYDIWFCRPVEVYPSGLQSQNPWVLISSHAVRERMRKKGTWRKDDIRMCWRASPGHSYILRKVVAILHCIQILIKQSFCYISIKDSIHLKSATLINNIWFAGHSQLN